MSGPVLIPALVQLRTEINAIAPDRQIGADGWIGDTAHKAEISDHNDDEVGNVPIHDADSVHEVHAVDVTTQLVALEMETLVQFILARCRSGAETRLRYIIFNRRIWRAANGWRQEVYTGKDPHTGHAHFSGVYTTAGEADRRSWHLEEIPVALTAADKNWLTTTINNAVQQHVDDTARAVWGAMLDIDTGTGVNLQPAGGILAYTSSEHHRIEDTAAAARAAAQEAGNKVDEVLTFLATPHA